MITGPVATVTGDTTSLSDNQTSSCQQGGAPEAVYQLTIDNPGILSLTLSSAADMGLYVRTACADTSSEVSCSDAFSGGADETLSMPVTQGQVLFIFVDGYSGTDFGPFTLTVQAPEPEVCTDGQDNDGDGLVDCQDPDCSGDPACSVAPYCASATPINLAAANSGDTTSGSNAFAGSCTGTGAHEALYSYTPPASGVLSLSLNSTADMGLYVRSDCPTESSELACVDNLLGGNTEHLTVTVAGGTPLTIFVDGYAAAESGPFTLSGTFTQRTINDVEPNDSPGAANSYTNPFVGSISPSGDQDYVKVVVPGPSSTLTATTSDLGNGACANLDLDSEVELFAPNGTTSLGLNDDISSSNYCSSLTVSGLAAGTYYVRVGASQYSPGATFAYQLQVTVQ